MSLQGSLRWCVGEGDHRQASQALSLIEQPVRAGLPARLAAPDKALSLASQLPPRSRQPVDIDIAAQAACGGLPAMQAALDKALSLASQLL